MLVIKDMSFSYPLGDNNKKKIVDNFSYTFEKGKTYGIFGRSGLGKSTLARIISGFLSPSDGSIKVNDKIVKKPNKDIVYMNQKDDIFYRLSVYENLYLLCHDKKKVENVLHSLNLLEYANYYPKHLSGGMIKRLSFARVLLIQPSVLILDEPFVYLDTSAKRGLINLLFDLRKNDKKMIIIVISHNMKEIEILDTIITFKHSINNNYVNKKKT